MVRHMLVQIPLLVVAGVLLAPAAEQGLRRIAGARTASAPLHDPTVGAALVLLASFTFMFWMLPRWLDAAVNGAGADAAKMVTLVLLCGLPLGLGWRRLGAVGRGFLISQIVSMLLILGVLYRTWPDRLCNNYLVGEQELLGTLMLVIAALAGLWGASRAMFPGARPPGLR